MNMLKYEDTKRGEIYNTDSIYVYILVQIELEPVNIQCFWHWKLCWHCLNSFCIKRIMRELLVRFWHFHRGQIGLTLFNSCFAVAELHPHFP